MDAALQKTRHVFHLYHSRLVVELRLLLPFLFLLSLLTSLALGKTDFEITKDRVLGDPRDTQARLILANQLLQNNQRAAAKEEFLKAHDPVGLQQVTKLESEPEEIKTQIVLWEKITNQLPNYRDAYLKLAILNYKTNRLFDAKKFLDKALEIDPNDEAANKILKNF